ncbi:GNAT family N-acetyltransferase [Pedobacter aquatilis]|uniref:GNAT family N-acetyltransferase n=1 Tax=Pedobacter aquatilis TaxID=351343 RepID=UPI002931A42E|nr:GNAT family N-acetyltransferase [Pedobacter aquatilis]
MIKVQDDSLIITPVKHADIAELQKIGRETFLETFSTTNSAENMKDYLDKSFSDDNLLRELNNAESSFYFAILAGKVVGYLKLNTGSAQTEKNMPDALEIERIYVLAGFHGKSVGQSLFNKALEFAKEKNYKVVWLGVWENNHRAIKFYAKNGFEVFDSHVFHLGADKQTDLMMKKQLS